MKILKKIAILITIAMLLSFAGCKNDTGEQSQDDEKLQLKIGVMPAVDSAPIFLADQNGYFDELGLDVEVQIYTNAMNRQSALQSGELDGAMTDVIALVNNVENGFDIKVTTSTDGAFPFLINKDYDGSKDVKVGMMEISVSNYLTDKSLKDYQVEKVYINEIPARLEMVATGNLDMAVIPEPMASQGELNGLKKDLIENDDEFSPDVMVFTGTAISEKEEELKLFHQAYNKAVEVINEDDSAARDVLIQTLELNPDIKDSILMPEYNKARVPSEEFLKGIMEWNETVIGKTLDMEYEELVESRFVND
ncbi:ABC transporter substrate-binding protein [Alkalibacter mobilis]|uniref:ABC transporter substrate-binding protein n=1 Tax=Alkalibacter mobilis TaxID=2787712 RepID=UPI00189C9040|nr:ABC transporter substrate-binding protein [Alkalibacter mobilis]MBF7096768.1 ABC transporter substrate-binding protein [Alkalibacter mobilis]